MFGFGRSANEKAVINSFALQLAAMGLVNSEALDNATKIVDEVLSDLRSRGIDPFKTTLGTEYITKEAFVAPRIAAGLTVEDVRGHWNRPLLIVFCEVKIRELINFIVLDVARQQGKDIGQAGSHYKKTFPSYGNPARWDSSEKFNAGLREVDADLYPEFAARVDVWQRRTGDVEVARLIEQHGTLNAVVRQSVAGGVL